MNFVSQHSSSPQTGNKFRSATVCVQKQSLTPKTVPVFWNLLPHVVKRAQFSEQRARGEEKGETGRGTWPEEIKEPAMLLPFWSAM